VSSLALLLARGLLAQSAPPAPAADLGVDPVTLLQWREACRIVSEHEDEIWPGYRLGEIPALMLRPGVAEVLLRHPRPPSGYVPHLGGSPLDGELLLVRRGATLFDVGMDTSVDLNGVRTLVVTDRGARGGADDAWCLAVQVHEGFHAFAARHLRMPGMSELDLADYPDLDAERNARLHLEGSALERALLAEGADEVEEAALAFLAERSRRRAGMAEAVVRFEDGNEWNEGLATYAEWRALELWARHGVAADVLAACPGLRFPESLVHRADQLRIQLGHSARGTLSINGSPFGPAAVRRRGYFFGAAIGRLLDRFRPGWKAEAAQARPLTALLFEALGEPSDRELGERADALEREAGLAALTGEKRANAAAAAREREQRIAAVLAGAGTLLRIDVAALAPSGSLAPSSYTPFGILAAGERRRLFSMSPTDFSIGPAKVTASASPGVIVDEARRELLVRSPIGREELVAALSRWRGRHDDPAVAILAPAAECAREDDGSVRLRLLAVRR